jgi:hydrogenase small subunit
MSVEFVPGQHTTEQVVIHALWMTSGLSCDGDSVSMTSATNPSLEDLIRGIIPGMPKLVLHHPLLSYENGAEFLQAWYEAEAGKLDPFILLLEGSVPNEELSGAGHWAALGVDPVSGQPITTNEWIDRLAPKAAAVVAVGTCATYGGIPAMKNNPTGAMGLPDYLGWSWKSSSGIPIVCIPGCPAQPDNITETITYIALMLAGMAPMIELDTALRPRWLFDRTVHESCNRAAFCEHGDFATGYGNDHRCMVKLGCKGTVAKCNVPLRGWVRGVGGCPNVGGICIGCTMPGFPDKFTPFMDRADMVKVSSNFARFSYGPILHFFRNQAMRKNSDEPNWRQQSPSLTSGYAPRWNSKQELKRLLHKKYSVAGSEARYYEFGPSEYAKVEVNHGRYSLNWTSNLNARDWLETLHERASAKTPLGLVILKDDLDPRGDLTWRETQALIEDTTRAPALVRVELGPIGLVWQEQMPRAENLWQVGVVAKFFDPAQFRELMISSASPLVAERIDEILEDARLAKHWD